MHRIIFLAISLIVFNRANGQDSLKNTYKVNIYNPQKDSTGSNQTASLVSFGDGTAIDATTAPVIMPSPNSAALTNLISDNVDLYTGKTNVNLPLYTLKSGSISLPISLQANVNAHRVNDIGSWVGLGWNLNAGGVITRVMKNLPDEFAGNTISTAYQMPGWGYLNIKGNGQNVDLSVFNSPNPDINVLKNIIAKGNWNVKSNWPDRGWDLQPDEFYFNFGNYSGKFVFDQDGGINLIPQANLKITPLFQVINGVNKITAFIVLTEDGFKYEFGKTATTDYNSAPVEETKMTIENKSMLYTYRAVAINSSNSQVVEVDGIPLPQSINGYSYWVYERYPYLLGGIPGSSCQGSGNSPVLAGCFQEFNAASTNETTEYFSYPSSWMLNKITSPTDDFIIFNYSTGTTISYQNDRSFSASLPTLMDDILRFQLTSNGGLIRDNNGNRFMPVFVSAISPNWDPFRRIFTLPAKQNFTVSKTMIELKSKKLLSITTSENNKIDFSSITPREDFIGDNRLDFITIKDRNNLELKKINFNYNIVNTSELECHTEEYDYKVYPSRYSITSGGSFIKMDSYFSSSWLYEEPPVYKTIPWSVPPEFRNRMFLSSVQEVANGVSSPAYSFNYENGKLPFRTSTEQDFYGFATDNPTHHPFSSDGHPSQRLTYKYNFPYIPPNTTTTAPLSRPILFFNSFGPGYSALYGATKNASVVKMRYGVLDRITYPTGGYKEFEFEFSGNSVAWNGLRVKQVREYESSVSAPILKNYSYGTFISTDAVLNSEYNYPTNNYYMGEAGVITPLNVYYALARKFFSSNRVNPENSTKGSAGGYTFAEISQPGNGKYRVEFNTAIDFPDNANETQNVSCFFDPPISSVSFSYPFSATSSLDWKRGLPKNETILNQSGLRVKYDVYNYITNPALYGQKEISGFNTSVYKIWALSPYSSPNCPNQEIPGYWLSSLYGKTTYTSSWYPQVKKMSRIYDQNGINYTESTQEYEFKKYTFNNKDYLFQYQQKDLKNSQNEQTVSYGKYPLDYNSTNIYDPVLVAIQNLKTKHILNAKIEQFSWRQDQNGNNKKYIGGILNKYHTDKPLIKEVFKLKTNGLMSTFVESNTNNTWFNFDPHYSSEVEFPLYDANGRIIEQNKTNDIKETYIWNYNKMYPVAKTVNANQGEVAYSSFEADEANSKVNFIPANVVTNASIAHTGRKYYSLNDQNPLNANITTNIAPIINNTYKLSLWAKGGDVMIWHVVNGIYNFMTIPAPIKTRSDWNYYEIVMPSNFSGIAAISKQNNFESVFADEVRLIPSLSQMNTYTFDPLIGMTSETDVNGKTVYYEYDKLNRLTLIKNEDKDIVKRICYNYANLVVPCDQ
ncbi:MAG: hypothetical protein IPN43_09285 [Chitinophagaceae bacterium]|nr:hypothetical protein [Chitinophagaceae bacterium]